MKKLIPYIVAAVLLGALLFVYTSQPRKTAVHSGLLQVTASFYPLAEFAQQVGGDKVQVTNLTPAGAEPHDFDPSPQDIVKLQNSQVFIYNGVNLEPWADRVVPDLQSKGVVIVKASSGITLLTAAAGEGGQDPHIWMDPMTAIQEVEAIKTSFIQADPAHTTTYETNAAAYQHKLQDLHQAFTQGLASCQRQDIVTSHAAFGYLARQYGLNMIPIAGLSPDAEPSPQRLAQIATFAKDHQLKYIFFESLVSPRLADTIASEVGAQTITFNPLEGLTASELAQGKNYITVQQENLDHLTTALLCH